MEKFRENLKTFTKIVRILMCEFVIIPLIFKKISQLLRRTFTKILKKFIKCRINFLNSQILENFRAVIEKFQ